MKNEAEKHEKKRLFIFIGVLIILLILFAFCIVGVTMDYQGRGVILDSFVSTSVHRADGRNDLYESNYFETAGKGDRVTATIPLPKELYISNSVLLCSVYQCVVNLYYDGKSLYSYGEEEAESGEFIGNVLICADIPDEAWGKELVLDCNVVDYTDFSKLNTVIICEAKNRTQYMLGNSTFSFILSMSVLVASFVMFFVLLLWGRGGSIRLQGIYLSVFCIGLMMWQMGYERMFYVFSNNVGFCGGAEYFGLFLAPAPFSMFMCYVEPNKLFQKIMKVLAGIIALLFVITTILNFTTAEYHYCRFLKVIHLLIIIVAFAVLAEFVLVRCRGDNKRMLLRIGVILYVIFAVSDMVLFYLDKLEAFHVNMGSKSITSLGLYVFLLMMLIVYVLYVLGHVVTLKEKKRLEKMAYIDGMTGIANRRGCLDFIKELNNKKYYTVFFFDVNNLKPANDKYGHDVGDQLIRTVALMLSDIFGQQGFCGRYGGDEFITAVEYSDSRKISHIEDIVKRELAEINSKKKLPFDIEVAYGFASNTEVEGCSSDDVVKMADERMYENKRRMKGQDVGENDKNNIQAGITE